MPVNLNNGVLLFYNSCNEMIPCGDQSRLTSCVQTCCKYGSCCNQFRSVSPQTSFFDHGFAHGKVPKVLEAQTGSRYGESSVHFMLTGQASLSISPSNDCFLRQKILKVLPYTKEQNDQTGEVLLG